MTQDQREKLEFCLMQTHRKAARRDNASTQVLIGTWQSNGNNLIGAITAALQTFGGRHAPIKNTMKMLEWIYDLPPDGISKEVGFWILDMNNICPNGKLPGFGSSFAKGVRDDMLYDLWQFFDDRWTVIESRIRQELASAGKNLWPNLAFYTAAAAIELGININFCEHLMIEARIEEWIKILKEQP